MNAPPATLTITSITGPGVTNTAIAFADVTSIEIDFVKNTIKVVHGGTITYYDYSATATVTWTITAGATTVVISS